ncbi:type VI secretion system tube protein TssD [Emticicia soli]|uniref:Type VI secretion system tube protein TssD n=1 Tax=Emticicia soli TaxID=2027878 RepID=A0ABW5J582_9BACT
MASFSATFNAAGSGDCEVVACNFSFNQSIDEKGRPSSKVHGGTIRVTIVATDNTALVGWMLDPYKKDSGQIVYNRIDQESTLKEIKFEDAYCVEYTENFDARGGDSNAAFTITLTISANKIVVGGASLDNKWGI